MINTGLLSSFAFVEEVRSFWDVQLASQIIEQLKIEYDTAKNTFLSPIVY